MAKILTARQAVDTYFYDGATVTFGGFANGLMHPEEIMVALEEAARSSGHPRGLRVVYASGQGDSGERGLNHLAVNRATGRRSVTLVQQPESFLKWLTG